MADRLYSSEMDIGTERIQDELEGLVTIGRGGEIYLFGEDLISGIARGLDMKIPVIDNKKNWEPCFG